jgi:hypothetical protein
MEITETLLEKLKSLANLWLVMHPAMKGNTEADELVNGAVILILDGKVDIEGNLMYAIQKSARQNIMYSEDKLSGEEPYDGPNTPQDEVDEVLEKTLTADELVVFKAFIDLQTVYRISLDTGFYRAKVEKLIESAKKKLRVFYYDE